MTMSAMDPALTAAYDTCRRMHRRHDPTYYWATRRLPADVRPATHALYGYVGQRILHGEVPYRDAWDQKPPGIHATYAGLWTIWPDERVGEFAHVFAPLAQNVNQPQAKRLAQRRPVRDCDRDHDDERDHRTGRLPDGQ